MKILNTELPDVKILEPQVFADDRGFFMELWQAPKYADLGIPETWAQDNLSFSGHKTLRGLHFQCPGEQGKLVQAVSGTVFDVVVDVRPDSPNFKCWIGVELSAENHRQLWIPPGFAHGFCVLSESALFLYKCDSLYFPAGEHTLLWNDPEIGIEWPVQHPKLSAKDEQGVLLRDFSLQKLPRVTASMKTAKVDDASDEAGR